MLSIFWFAHQFLGQGDGLAISVVGVTANDPEYTIRLSFESGQGGHLACRRALAHLRLLSTMDGRWLMCAWPLVVIEGELLKGCLRVECV